MFVGRRCFLFLTSFLLTLSVAKGDDLEIYLGTAGEELTYDPNVLFIMDTSGSMGNRDGTGESRIARVQDALNRVLSSATNINAGLMRFSDLGGPVLYPIRSIDEPAEPQQVIAVSDSDADGYDVNGNDNISNQRVRLVSGTDTVTSGFHFTGVRIPQGATITSAYLRFTSAGFNTSDVNMTIAGEQVTDANDLSMTNDDIGDRTWTTTTVDWSVDNQWAATGEPVITPDLTGIVQELVNQAGWCGGQALNLLIEGVGDDASDEREVLAFDEGSGRGAELVIGYDQASATGCTSGQLAYQVSNQKNNLEERNNGYEATGSELTFDDGNNEYIAVRFENVTIPQGATIENAYLEFTAYQNGTGSGAAFSISGINQPNPNHFGNRGRYFLRDIAKTASVRWNNIPPFYKNGEYASPSIKSIVQQLVNQGDWEAGNAMGFVFSDITGRRGAYTYRGRPSGAPRLIVEFKGNANPDTVATVRDHLKNEVESLSANGFTPIVDTLLEAVNYYGGRAVDYGLARGDSSVNNSVRRSTRVSHRLSYTGGDSVLPYGCSEDNLSDSDCIGEYIPSGAVYQTPVTDLQCQTNNHIVLLSDGEANNNHSISKVEALLGQSCEGSSWGERCGTDLVKNISRSTESVIDARITTHTIGFAANDTANNYLSDLANNGGGGFYQADNADNLVEVFQTILKRVKDINATFVSPGVAVNQLNRLTHRDELYFALFKPSEGTFWPGNLKKYKISGDTILDKNGLPAVDESSGFFSDTAHSYWSIIADGNDVREGGAASRLDLLRNIFFFDGAGSVVTEAQRLHENNDNITITDLGLTAEADAENIRNSVLKWARGVDIFDADGDGSNTDARLQMGDPIHSKPVVVNYSASDSAILVGTNQGFLHSFDAETGEQNFAIIPQELLANLYDFYRDDNSFNHIYGMDGDLVLRRTSSELLLYAGMRRGGRNYYAFDISNKTSPSVKFAIEGGSSGFEQLGQTWSRPTITKVKVGGTVKDVLIFGGGYDDAQDAKEERSGDTLGNAVYMVDADTGALLWHASNANAELNLASMNYSIPARISVIDRDNDGLADHMYAVDMGGQLFRLDIHNGESGASLVSGGQMADFGADSSVADARRFFYGPDVAEVSFADSHYYAVAVGSGFRAHPLNTDIQDHFIMVKDTGVFEKDEDGNYGLPGSPLTLSDLYDATDHRLTSDSDSEREIAEQSLADKHGWYIRLGTGEKVLAAATIIDYKIFFTTYLPAAASDSLCAPPTGNSRAYLVELVTGNAVDDFNNDDRREHGDRYADLQQTGIAPETKVLVEDPTQPAICVGTECASAAKDPDGEKCRTEFECLSERIYGQFERVRRSSWETEVETDD